MNIPKFEKDFHLMMETHISKHYPLFRDFINDKYSYINQGTKTWMCRLWHFYNNVDDIPVCKECGKPVKFISLYQGYRNFCSARCSNKNKEIFEKKRKTWEGRYGVDHPMKNENVKNKLRNTTLERYGEEFYNNREKNKETCIEKYGVLSYFETEDFKNRAKQAFLEKYGVDNPVKSPEVREKIKETNMVLYGCEYALQSPKVREKIKETNMVLYGCGNPQQNPEIREKTRQTNQERYGVDWYCQALSPQNPSDFETRYLNYIEELIKPFGWTLKRNYNKILGGKELDGYIPEINKAFEFNGSYWHSIKSPGFKKDQHKIKFFRCLFKKINLLQIWEDTSFELGCSLIKSFIFDESLEVYKKELYKDLDESQHPCDLGIPKNGIIGEWKEHICVHNNHTCYDAGYFQDSK